MKDLVAEVSGLPKFISQISKLRQITKVDKLKLVKKLMRICLNRVLLTWEIFQTQQNFKN